jgi:four helix bundle protein
MDGMKDSPLREKSMDFAVRIVALARALRDECKEYALADQVLRSGTAIGANLAEAAFAPTKRDFLNKNKIALKECSETRFWLDLLARASIFPTSRLAPLRTTCTELLRMLAATCKTTQERLSNQ